MIRNNKGFTLVELMVVIVIIGVLAALAIPKFTEASVKAKVTEAPTVLSSFDNACLARIAETSALPQNITDVVMDDPTVNNFSKWFTYTFSSGANAQLQATAKSAMGGISAGDPVTTQISSASVVTHTMHANYNRYLPNWPTP